jgi:hypothetical protein
MTKSKKAILPILALVVCMGAFLFPTTAFAQVSDTTPPTLTAELSGGTLNVQAKDDDSGVEAIYVDGNRFSTLVNGAASIKLGSYAGDNEQVTIYATDAAGNRSQSVLVDNPYYVAPATPSAGAASTANAAVTSAPEASPSPSPTAGLALPEPVTPAALSEGEETTESGITGNQTAFTPDGGGTVMDNATEEDGKEFFTVTATDGSVYYLIIDRQRGTENVYFLSAVTRDDLTSLAEDGAATESGLAAATPEPLESEPPEEELEQEEPVAQGSDNTGTVIFILLVVAIAGGAGYYFKIVKPRRLAQQDNDEYEEELEDEDNGGKYVFEGEENRYYDGEPDTEKEVDNDRTASYNDTTEENGDS